MKTVPQAEPTPHPPFGHLPLEGKAKSGRTARLDKRTAFARTRKLSPLYTTSPSLPPPVAPVPRGVSGGGAALSSLCRRFPGGDIMNLTSRRSPLSGLSFSEFFFLRERKTDRRRRSDKISVGKTKSPEKPKQKKFSTPREPLQHRALPLCQQNCPDFSTDFST